MDTDLNKRRAWGIILGLIFILLSLLCKAQTKDQVYAYIISCDIEHPSIVYQQVLKETGHLKCTACSLNRNNLFGFRYNHKYLEFDTWQESIDYYERWQLRKGYQKGQDYYDFLARKWGAPNMETRYLPRLKQIKIN